MTVTFKAAQRDLVVDLPPSGSLGIILETNPTTRECEVIQCKHVERTPGLVAGDVLISLDGVLLGNSAAGWRKIFGASSTTPRKLKLRRIIKAVEVGPDEPTRRATKRRRLRRTGAPDAEVAAANDSSATSFSLNADLCRRISMFSLPPSSNKCYVWDKKQMEDVYRHILWEAFRKCSTVLRGKWIPSEYLLQYIQKRYVFPKSFQESHMQRSRFNKMVFKENSMIENTTNLNTTGQYRMQPPLHFKRGDKRSIPDHLYYFGSKCGPTPRDTVHLSQRRTGVVSIPKEGEEAEQTGPTRNSRSSKPKQQQGEKNATNSKNDDDTSVSVAATMLASLAATTPGTNAVQQEEQANQVATKSPSDKILPNSNNEISLSSRRSQAWEEFLEQAKKDGQAFVDECAKPNTPDTTQQPLQNQTSTVAADDIDKILEVVEDSLTLVRHQQKARELQAEKVQKERELQAEKAQKGRELQEEQARKAREKLEEFKRTHKIPLYWESTDAKRLFRPNSNETVRECLGRRIEFLDDALSDYEEGYTRVLPDDEYDEYYTVADGIRIRIRMMILRRTYHLALERLGWGVATLTSCGMAATEQLKQLGIQTRGQRDDPMRLNQHFRESETLPHCSEVVKAYEKATKKDREKRMVPKIFELFPTAKHQIVEYAKAHESKVTADFMRAYINDILVPGLFEAWKNTHNVNYSSQPWTVDTFVRRVFRLQGGIKKRTVSRWLTMLGFDYIAYRKRFRVPDQALDEIDVLRKPIHSTPKDRFFFVDRDNNDGETQCIAITNRKKRCHFVTINDTAYCSIHQDYEAKVRRATNLDTHAGEPSDADNGSLSSSSEEEEEDEDNKDYRHNNIFSLVE